MRRGKLLLRCVVLGGASAPTEGGEGQGHIMAAARLQFVWDSVSSLPLRLCGYVMFTVQQLLTPRPRLFRPTQEKCKDINCPCNTNSTPFSEAPRRPSFRK